MTIIIQARMTSTRLPGKVMLPIAGQPILYWVIDRCRKTGERVIVAAPNEEESKPIVELCKQKKIEFYLGHVDDLTRRYADCVRDYELTGGVVRITADCPFINTDLINLCILQWNRDGGYVGFHGLAGLNVEVFGVEQLQEALQHGPDEHCTTWMRKQRWAKDLESLEVNTKEDYERLKNL